MIAMLADIGMKLSAIPALAGTGTGLTSNDYTLINEFARDGDEWAIQWKYHLIPANQFQQNPIVTQVCNIFSMWDRVMRDRAALSATDQATLATLIGPRFSAGTFRGFDFNNEPDHAHVANILINKLNAFQYMGQAGCSNSHSPLLSKYLAMVAEYNLVIGDFPLTLNDLANIINATP